MPLIIPSNSISGEFEVANSLRFNDDSSDYLNRTPSSAGSTRLATFSLWLKRANISVTQYLYMVNDGTNQFGILFGSDNKLKCFHWNGSSYDFDLETSALFRDVSAWYHIVIKIDTANATAIERLKLFVNNEYVAWNSTPSQNFDGVWLKNSTTHIGATTTPSNYLDGYIAEFVAIDGTALDPTSFGEFDSDTNIWKPIDVSGLTFGTNGFYLDFENASSLGADVSGNGNNFTVNNLTSVDQSTDTCTNNFATLNPLDINPSSAGDTFSEGNLKLATNNSSNAAGSRSTIAVSSGKWYCEVKYVSNTAWNGVMATDTAITGGMTTGTIAWYQGRTLYVDGSNSGNWGSVLSAGDIQGIALDMDNNRVTVSQGGQWWGGSSFNQSQPHTFQNLTSGYDTWSFLCRSGSGTSTSEWNFGSPSFSISSGNSDANGYGNFEYAVPNSYYSLCTKNLAEYG